MTTYDGLVWAPYRILSDASKEYFRPLADYLYGKLAEDNVSPEDTISEADLPDATERVNALLVRGVSHKRAEARVNSDAGLTRFCVEMDAILQPKP